ncbi:alpha/beta hydrolase [Micromonospora sp. CV4]|uniref:alpha/beta hydrolase n=1 Tax=Micromonospora sp. CV4 TaxID=2478711 RepID=UPI000EF488FE|nr:alpha/beta fold hydrolase [Micromonospora sp. CV4]RLP97895.1 alpha/beta fold hydrolase [Micromonospora sp. CV4]
MAATGRPVVFVHGMFLHAASWASWVELFRAAGHDPLNPGWPGEPSTVEEARQEPDRVAGNGIDDIVAHHAQIIRTLDTRPIVIGHSTGAVVAQRLLAQDLAAAAVALQPPPIKGVNHLAPSTVPVGWPLLRNPANRRRALSLTARQFRYSHGNALTATESDQLYRQWTVPSPGRPVFELVSANLSRRSPAAIDAANPTRGPLLMIAGGRDHSAHRVAVKATVKRYRASAAVTDYQEFRNRRHSMPIDSGWREIADAKLVWLRQHLR